MENTAEWVVIGAGPAGVSVLSNILSHGVKEEEIFWIDPKFDAGWLSNVTMVSGNTKVALFRKFFTSSEYLAKRTAEVITDQHKTCPFGSMESLPQDVGCELKFPVEAMRAVTAKIRTRIRSASDYVASLHESEAGSPKRWKLVLKNGETVFSNNVVFCTGSHQKELDLHRKYPHLEVIPLLNSFSPVRLKEFVGPKDTVAVFGTSHSGMLVLKILCSDLPDQHQHRVSKVLSFSKKPVIYAEYRDGWIKNDGTGLKLAVAEWSRNNYDSEPHHPMLTKVPLTPVEEYNEDVLTTCTKIIYAIGFERGPLPDIFLKGSCKAENVNYNNKTGQITSNGTVVPGLFGLGIAFPENKLYPDGTEETVSGLWKFMDYSQRVVPTWLAKQKEI